MKINRLAAIDVGSNSVKLLITDIINHAGRIVYKNSSFTRVPLQLGEDTFAKGYISERKKQKLMELLKTFKSLMLINDVEDWTICATSSLREASNSEDVVSYVYENTGLKIDVISQRKEADFVFQNFSNSDIDEDKINIVVDVGGGCTEVFMFNRNQQPISESFNLGTIRNLTPEQELSEWRVFEEWIDTHRNNHRNVMLIGSGGNINKLNSIFRKKGKIRKYDFSNYYKKLKSMKYEDLIMNSNLGLNRAEVILPAMRIYLQIMKILKVDEIQIPVIGVADGMIRNLYLNKFVFAGKNEI